MGQRNNMISPNITDETIDDGENDSGDQKPYKSHQQRTPIAGLVEVSNFQSLKPSPNSSSDEEDSKGIWMWPNSTEEGSGIFDSDEVEKSETESAVTTPPKFILPQVSVTHYGDDDDVTYVHNDNDDGENDDDKSNDDDEVETLVYVPRSYSMMDLYDVTAPAHDTLKYFTLQADVCRKYRSHEDFEEEKSHHHKISDMFKQFRRGAKHLEVNHDRKSPPTSSPEKSPSTSPQRSPVGHRKRDALAKQFRKLDIFHKKSGGKENGRHRKVQKSSSFGDLNYGRVNR